MRLLVVISALLVAASASASNPRKRLRTEPGSTDGNTTVAVVHRAPVRSEKLAALFYFAKSINAPSEMILESIRRDLPGSTWTALDVERYRDEVRFSLSVPEWIHELLSKYPACPEIEDKAARMIVQRSAIARYTDIHAVRSLVKHWLQYCITPLRVVKSRYSLICSRALQGNGQRWELTPEQASNYILGLSLDEYNRLTTNT